MNIQGLLTPGSALGRYELLMPIAQGGMAAVWAARQMGSRGFEKTVAIKTMLPKLKEDPMFERMFLNEATLATRIQHPNVAQILDLGEEAELLYIVMEWVDGEALSLVMRAADQAGEVIPRELSVGIMERACWGLHAAHEVTNEHDENAGIVHRDVSPQNILVGYNGSVKVVDFGVAKVSGISGMETNTGSLKGKVPFMSPEQASGGRIDRRTDVFAVGTLLYKLVTGVHPFVGANDLMTLQAIITEEPRSPREHDPSIGPDLEAIILRCLCKDVNGRFSNMAELAHALSSTVSRVSEQDIATYIGRLVGARGAQRRATLKQAARSLGWATQTNDQLPRVYQQQPTPSRPYPTPSHPGSGSFSAPGDVRPSGSAPGHPTAVTFGPPTHASAGTRGMSALAIVAIALAAFAGLSAIVLAVLILRAPRPTTEANSVSSTVAVANRAPQESAAPAVTATASSPAPSGSPTLASSDSAGPVAQTSAKPKAGTSKPKPKSTASPSTTGDVDMGF